MRRRLAAAKCLMGSVRAATGIQRKSLSPMSGRNQRRHHLCDKTAALWAQRRMATAAGVANAHTTTPATGNGVVGWISTGPLWRKLNSANAVVGRVAGRSKGGMGTPATAPGPDPVWVALQGPPL